MYPSNREQYYIYASKTYESFETLSMLKFLRADVTLDHEIDVDDAAAIINVVVGAN